MVHTIDKALTNKVSAHYAQHLKVFNIDVDERIQLVKQLEIIDVPILVLLKPSGATLRLVVGVNAENIYTWLGEQFNPEDC